MVVRTAYTVECSRSGYPIVEKYQKFPEERVMMENGEHLQVEEPVILQGDLSLYPKFKVIYEVTLTSKKLECVPKTGVSKRVMTFDLKDIIGCDCMRGKNEGDNSAYVTFYAYPARKKFASKRTNRCRQEVTLAFNKHENYGENSKEAEQWKLAATALLKGLTIHSAEDLLNLEIPAPKSLLVLINPFSGPGKALQIFQQRVVPIFAEAGIHYTTVITERAGHATEIVQSMKLGDWYGIAIVSGDGLIYEVVNGLMSRSDWEQAIKTPLAALPGGSGNALCVSLNHYSNEPWLENFALHSSFIVAKHKVVPMDLVAVDTAGGGRVYSFLSVTWGLIADIDIESEKYRSLGNARFTVGALVRMFKLRRYRGRLSFLPSSDYEPRLRSRSLSRRVSEHMDLSPNGLPQPPRSQSDYDFSKHRSKPRAWTDLTNNSGISERSEDLEKSDDTGDSELISPDSIQAPPELVRVSDSDDNNTVNGLHNGLVNGHSDGVELSGNTDNSAPPSSEQNGHSALGENPTPDSEETSMPHCPTPLLAPLDEPVPPNWVVIEGEFVVVSACYQSHLGPDYICGKDATPDQGEIHLSFVHGDIQRSKLLQLFLNTEEGQHLEGPDIETVKVKAFRIEPLQETGHLAVDGEKVPYGPIQGQILPGISRVLMKS